MTTRSLRPVSVADLPDDVRERCTTPADAGRALAALAPPITDAQALECARILASAAA